MHATLLLIDFQRAFLAPDWGARNNPHAEAQARQLLTQWRETNGPIAHVRHVGQSADSLFKAGTEAIEFLGGLEPHGNEPVFTKSVNSGFIGTELETHLRNTHTTDLVICGLTTPHCVSTTTRMAANLGFTVTLAHDACAAFETNAAMDWMENAAALDAETVHRTAVAHLHGEFATARSTQDILKGAS